jgi:hypothetical protein
MGRTSASTTTLSRVSLATVRGHRYGIVWRSPCERALREAAVQTLNVGGMGMCTALRFARHAAIRYLIRPRLSGDGIAALSAAYSNQAGWFDCGRMQARVR